MKRNGLRVFVDQNLKAEESSSDDGDERGTPTQLKEAANIEEGVEVPERQGLLPPLPDINDDLNNPVFFEDSNSSSHSRTQSLEKVITMTSLHRTRTSSYNNKATTPTPSIFNTPKADLHHDYTHTPSSSIVKLESGLVTPVRERLLEEDDMEHNRLEYSPTITIDERFDVKVDIPSEKALPRTTEDKIKFFETFQKKEAQEFDKTLKSLKKGGWITSKDLSSLETKKHNHFKKWEIKIKELKNSLRHKKFQQGIHGTPPISSAGSGSVTSGGHIDDFGYFSPKIKNDVENFEGDRSPNLQTLEQQFSVLGISQ